MSIKLKQAIAEYISANDLSEHQFMRLWNIGVRAIRELNMDAFGVVKTTLLYVESDKTVKFPQGLIEMCKIGVLNEIGEVVTLTSNKNLALLHSKYVKELGVETNVPVIGYGDVPFVYGADYTWFNYSYSNTLYNIYGINASYNGIGSYRIDYAEKEIKLSADWPYATILMEYISDGYDCGENDYFIPTQCAEAVISFIKWKDAEGLRKKYSTGEVMAYRKEYYNQKRLAKQRLNPISLHDMNAVYIANLNSSMGRYGRGFRNGILAGSILSL